VTDRATEPLEARLLSAGDVPVFVAVSGDDVTITRHDGAALRSFRADDVTEVRRDGDRVEIAVVRGEPLVLGGPRAAELDARLTAACMRLPELTRALRSLGSARAGANAAAQREFFAPLLDARRRAEESVARADVVAAFDPDRLGRAFEQYLAALAARTEDARPAARRAFAAYTDDLAEPLRQALDELRRARDAALAPAAGARVSAWRRWTGALRQLFAAAERCWMALDRGGVPRSGNAGA
jgi:hypothetical protein